MPLASRRAPIGFSASDKLSLLVVTAVVTLIVTLFMVSCSGGALPKYSEGYRTGLLQKYSSAKGVIWKSGEGEMLLEGLASSADGKFINNYFYFSVPDGAPIASKVVELTGRRVRVHYTQHLIRPMQQSTSYTVDAIEELK